MNARKLLFHRAVQTALIAAICAIVFNFLFVSINARDNKLHWNLDWQWIGNAILTSVLTCVLYVSTVLSKFSKLSYEFDGFYGILLGILFGVGFTITGGINSISSSVLDWILIGTAVMTAILALFNAATGKSMVFAIFFAGIVGTFTHLFWAYYDQSISGIFHGLYWGFNNLWTLSLIGLGVVIIVSRIVRWIFVFFFVKKHSFLKVVENGEKQ